MKEARRRNRQDKTKHVNITVPFSICERMQKYKDKLNWSGVAVLAFIKELQLLEAGRPPTMPSLEERIQIMENHLTELRQRIVAIEVLK